MIKEWMQEMDVLVTEDQENVFFHNKGNVYCIKKELLEKNNFHQSIELYDEIINALDM